MHLALLTQFLSVATILLWSAWLVVMLHPAEDGWPAHLLFGLGLTTGGLRLYQEYAAIRARATRNDYPPPDGGEWW